MQAEIFLDLLFTGFVQAAQLGFSYEKILDHEIQATLPAGKFRLHFNWHGRGGSRLGGEQFFKSFTGRESRLVRGTQRDPERGHAQKAIEVAQRLFWARLSVQIVPPSELL